MASLYDLVRSSEEFRRRARRLAEGLGPSTDAVWDVAERHGFGSLLMEELRPWPHLPRRDLVSLADDLDDGSTDAGTPGGPPG